MKLIDKDALVAEIESEIKKLRSNLEICKTENDRKTINLFIGCYNRIFSLLDTLEVKDPYKLQIQYASVKDAVQAHAETYSFNIESELFNQLTKEQQVLWRKEIEQACISGGDMGYSLARDIRYKENFEAKEVNLDKILTGFMGRYAYENGGEYPSAIDIAKHFFELGMAVSNKA